MSAPEVGDRVRVVAGQWTGWEGVVIDRYKSHAAMLAALVRAGVLTEDRERLVRACGCIANEEPAACCDPLASPHWERRYVTRWVAL